MKKIPTLFKRVFDENHNKAITREVTPGCEVVLEGKTTATVKYDGACCAIINGEIYRRYDAKQRYGKKPPEGAIPCQPEPDPITGHWPHWVKCVEGNPQDRYFLEAFNRSKTAILSVLHFDKEKPNGGLEYGKAYTTEAIGPHWQSNPYANDGVDEDQLVLHGRHIISNKQISDKNGNITFDSIREFLDKFRWGHIRPHAIEGLVFWYKGEPLCKIKRTDFGFDWPIKGNN